MSLPAETLRELRILAAGIEEVRGSRDDAFVLFVGSGSSLVNDRPVAEELLSEVLQARWGGQLSEQAIAALSLEERVGKFEEIWPRALDAARKRKLRELYDRLKPSPGHSSLAQLIKEGYFPFVLSSAIDPLLDNALAHVAHQEQMLLGLWRVWINGRDPEDEIREVLRKSPVDLAVVRLCGDFRYPGKDRSVPVTRSQVLSLIQPIKDALAERLQGSLIIVDYTPFDAFLLDVIPEYGMGNVFVIGRQRPDQQFQDRLYHRRPKYIEDPSLDFSTIMSIIAGELGVFKEVKQLTGKEVSRETIERLSEVVPEPAEAGESEPVADRRLLEMIKLEFERGQQQRGAPAAAPVETPIDLTLVEPSVTIFALHMDTAQHVSFSVEGVLNYKSEDAPLWRGDSPEELNAVMQDMGRDLANAHRLADKLARDAWRSKAKREGTRLRKGLIDSYSDLVRRLDLARHTVDDPENLTLVFSGPRTSLGMPYELLYLDDRPLVTYHPACRQVSGATSRHSQTFEAFARQLKRQKKPLRVLLLSADTNNLKTDQEIADLEQQIGQQAQGLVEVQIEARPTARSGIAEVEGLLKRSPYHIIHFAGHGAFDERTGENSGLLFWKDAGQRKEKVVLTARQLNEWLSGSETRLVYLSACVGARIGGEALLRANDYLGVLDAVVQAGVPYCLGYRWNVTDSGSRAFASLFYQRLFSAPFAFIPERAVYHARKERYAAAGTDDETWTSPILVAQNLYR
ncbi:MAG: hypothetical protein OHK0015_38520 [Chloroflexi bacterium OHK40]